MTDDAMRKAYDRLRRQPDYWLELNSFEKGWQAATTALLEKLRSEDVITTLRYALVGAGSHNSPLTASSEDLARAVIEALEKELVG